MNSIVRSRLFKWLMIAMAMLPAVMYGILGQFSRMLPGDDYGRMYWALTLGPWENVLNRRSLWGGSYSRYFIHGFIAPYDTFAVSVLPIVNIILLILGLSWLGMQVLNCLHVKRNKLALSVSFASIAAAASIHGQYVPEAFYWFSGSGPYFLPVILFMVFLAAASFVAQKLQSGKMLTAFAIAGAGICFVLAGFSEMHLAFQFSASLLLLLALGIAVEHTLRWKVIALLGAGIFGALCSLVVYVTAEGLHVRAAYLEEFPYSNPIRDLPELAVQSLFDVYGLVTHHETMAGFILLFALSLFMLPRIKGIRLPDVFSRPLNIGRWARLPYMICLVLQCAYLPILWAHHSDNPVFFGRFSLTYIVAVIVNLAIIIALLLAIWRYRQFEDFLRLEQRRLTLYMMTILVCALIFLAAPELRNMHYKVVGVLFLSAFSFFVLAWWQLALLSHDPVIGRLSLLALIWSASSLATAAIIVSITLFMAGKIWSPRFLASVAFLFTASGLVWGFAIGTMHKRRNPPDGKISILVSRLSALAFIVIYSGIVLGQIASFPHFTAFAREWQARDTLLREAAVSGQLHVEIPPTAFDLEAFLKRGEIVDDAGLDEWREGTLLNYYGLESITLIGEG